MAQGAILRNAGLKMNMLILMTVEASSRVDEDCRDTFGLLLTKAKSTVECAIGTTSIIVHHGGKSFIVIATAHASARVWLQDNRY